MSFSPRKERQKSSQRDRVKEGLPSINPDAIEEEHPGEMDSIVPSRDEGKIPIIGLGGSAGAITALMSFFEKMPPDSGLAFVVVLHLSPDHDSTLPALISRATPMKVVAAVDGTLVESDCVYVIPPAKYITCDDGHLQLAELEPERGRRVAVDLFFRSLADTYGSLASAVVLSGGDGDGTLGIKRIKERGGLTIAQDPNEAEHSGMPLSAINAGMVDWVLPVAAMPGRILEYHSQEKKLVMPPEQGPQPAEPEPVSTDAGESALREVLAYLRVRTGRDFSYYKRATIIRRISRRMQISDRDDLPSYASFLRQQPGEVGALLQDLLISVTNFFRDRDAFGVLEAMVPELFKGKSRTDTLRVWVPACATGEEAYSIGMLLLEHAGTLADPPEIQIFGCDLDENAIQVARVGFYPETIQADVSEERLRRFFHRETRGFRVRRELREIVLFAAHDLLKDPPFSRMDLVSCRNLMIYLTRDAQKRVLDILHFAMRDRALLFLGPSESVEDGSTLFEVVHKKQRLYRQQPTQRFGFPVPSDAVTLTRALKEQGMPPPVLPKHLFSGGSMLLKEQEEEAEKLSAGELHLRLLERFGPPSVVVNADYDVLHLTENAGRFLRFTGGTATTNLLRVVQPSLRLDLRAALFRATQSRETVFMSRVPVEVDGGTKAVNIRVAPACELAPGYLLVVFEVSDDTPAAERPHGTWMEEPAVRQLERELEVMRLRLRDATEQFGANTEELKASNEELQAMNEELRSASEELETSREELQSINEELITVNQELKSKIEELSHSNSDLHNLMAATSIATIFLDKELRIMRYTPSATELFNVIPGDIGRPLADLRHRLDYPQLGGDAERVLRELVPVEREVLHAGASSTGPTHFLVRVLPYRTLDDHIAGVVLTFVDISESKRADEALRLSEERLRLVVENAREFAIFAMDLERRVVSWNTGAEAILGFTAAEIIGQSVDVIFTPEDRAAEVPAQEVATALARGKAQDERWHRRRDGNLFFASGVTSAMRTGQGEVIGLLKIFRDCTVEMEIQKALEESRKELIAALQETERARGAAEAANQAKDHFLAILSHELRTPLTPVSMAIEMLHDSPGLPAEVASALELIERNVKMEARLIDDLLDMTRIGRSSLEICREPTDAHETVLRALDVCRSDAKAKKQVVEISLAAEVSRIQGDPTRLQQLFWNLLKNASKFTPAKGQIRVSSHNEGGKLVVEVQDSGIGFVREHADLIFDAFRQAPGRAPRQQGGLGLGLSIARAVAEAHGGSIGAFSEGEGRGARFRVVLPTTPDAAEEPSLKRQP